VVEGLVPAIDQEDNLKKTWPKRLITATQYENYSFTNTVKKLVSNESKCFDTFCIYYNTQQYSKLFFRKNIDW
jgi:hypothetical protein